MREQVRNTDLFYHSSFFAKFNFSLFWPRNESRSLMYISEPSPRRREFTYSSGNAKWYENCLYGRPKKRRRSFSYTIFPLKKNTNLDLPNNNVFYDIQEILDKDIWVALRGVTLSLPCEYLSSNGIKVSLSRIEYITHISS